MKRFIKRHIVDNLPPKLQNAIERVYLHRFVKNYIEDDVDVLRQLCDRRKISVDIGANCGVLTLFLCKFTTHVHCFEPLPWQVEFLRKKFHRCNVTVHDCALGNAEAVLPLHIPVAAGQKVDTRSSLVNEFADDAILGSDVTTVEDVKVQVKTLDAFDLQDVGFIKIDVEGFEFEVLEGAEQTIKANMPNLFIEIEERHLKQRTIKDIFDSVRDLGYHGYFVKDRTLRDLRDFDVRTMQDPSDEKTPNYINNFIFSPSKDLSIKL